MASHVDQIQISLASGPASARQLAENMGVSQPTVSRAISAAGDAIVRFGSARSIQYGLRDTSRGFSDIPVYRVSSEGRLRRLGVLVPVRPDGFVMQQDDGRTLYSEGLPWWLLDMRPQGFLGRAWASRHGATLGLPNSISDWSDSHALRALLVYGHDVVGNLILGDVAYTSVVDAPPPEPISRDLFPYLAETAERGDIAGSSAGGEQPKFAAYVDGRHVLVKFSAIEDNSVTQRWRDLLLAEHHALQALLEYGVSAAVSHVTDIGGRRYLEVERFDRVGATGRRALHSLTSLDAEFVGLGNAPWPETVARLCRADVVTSDAQTHTATLYAFGTLIGNTDMHGGNVSFIAEHGRPYAPAPAYDMLPMAFRPRNGGAIVNEVPATSLNPSVGAGIWQHAAKMAEDYVRRLEADGRFSEAWEPCLAALRRHIDAAIAKIQKLD